MKWFLDPIVHHYADFTGRATRKQYWLFQLWMLMFLAIFFYISYMIAQSRLPAYSQTVLGFGFLFILFGLFMPGLSLSVRRLHDAGLSGWWVLVQLIPYLGGLLFLVFMLLTSERGTNKYGPNPHGIDTQGNQVDMENTDIGHGTITPIT